MTTKVGLVVCRVGQNRIFTFIYTVYLVISKPKIPYVHRIYMVLANPRNDACKQHPHQPTFLPNSTGTTRCCLTLKLELHSLGLDVFQLFQHLHEPVQ